MAKLIDRLKGFYKVDTAKQNGREVVIPTERVVKKGLLTDKIEPVNFTDDQSKMFQYYLQQCTINREDIRKRAERYKLLRSMYYENTIIYLAVEMLANESIAVQDNTNFITVKSKSSKLTKKINDLLTKWEVNQNRAKNIFQSLYLFGDSFKFRKITEEGVVGFNYLDVDDVIRRLEYNPLKVDNEVKNTLNTLTSNYTSLKDLIDVLNDKNNIDLSNLLDSRLLGWELRTGHVLPPWCISHTRLYSSESDFYPYGRSLFINSLSAFLQLKASKNLMVMARANNFPIEVFKLTPGENQTETEKWNALNRFAQNYNNLTSQMVNAEQKGIKSTILTIEGLFEYSVEKPDMNLDQIADIEMLEMDLLRPTGIPLDLILGRGGDHSSGKLLSTQSLFFNRKIEAGHSAFLENIMEDIKLHLYITDDPEKDEDFELEMYAPQSEQSADYFSTRTSSLDLVTSIMDTVKEVLGIDSEVEIPENIAIELFSKFSFLDPADSRKIIKAMYQARDKAKDIVGGEEEYFSINNDVDINKNLGLDAEPQDDYMSNNNKQSNDDTGIGDDKEESKKVFREKITLNKRFTEEHLHKLKKLNKQILVESYFEVKKNLGLTEGIVGNKRFITSHKSSKELSDLCSVVKSYLEKDVNKKQSFKD